MTATYKPVYPRETEADKIWTQIKDLKIQLFALPAQKIEENVVRMPVSDDEVCLKLKSQAVLPALEEALKDVPIEENKMWEVVQTTKYTIVRKAAKV